MKLPYGKVQKAIYMDISFEEEIEKLAKSDRRSFSEKAVELMELGIKELTHKKEA